MIALRKKSSVAVAKKAGWTSAFALSAA